MDPSNGNPAAGSSIPPNPGTISSFNPQPDIPGMGDPGVSQASSSAVPPNPGEISGFNPQPDIPGMGNPNLQPGSDVEGAQPHMHPGDDQGIIIHGMPTDNPASIGNPDFHPGDSQGIIIHGIPTDNPASIGNPDFHPGDSHGIIIHGAPTDIPGGIGNPDLQPGDDQGIIIHETPTDNPAIGNPDLHPGWSAPGPPDRPASRSGLVLGIIAVLVIALVGGGSFAAAKAGVFGCQFTSRGLGRLATISHVETPCGPNGSGGSSTSTGRVAAPTATTAPEPTATFAPAATATTAPIAPTATKPPVAPTPSISISSPSNNYTATNTDGTNPYSDPITFRASATPGGGASSVTISWTDSVDGTLGTGTTLVKPLSSQHNTNCGGHTPHTVIATAKNNLGGTASVSITVNVVPYCHS